MHMNPTTEGKKIDAITETLTEKLYGHEYVITRQEAKDEMGLKVVYPPGDIEDLLWELYKSYQDDLLLEREIDPQKFLDSSNGYAIIDNAIIESTQRVHIYSVRGVFQRKTAAEVNFEAEWVGWEEFFPEEAKGEETSKGQD